MLLRCTRPGCQCLPKDRSHLAHSPPVAKITLHSVSDGKLLGLDGGKLARTKGSMQPPPSHRRPLRCLACWQQWRGGQGRVMCQHIGYLLRILSLEPLDLLFGSLSRLDSHQTHRPPR